MPLRYTLAMILRGITLLLGLVLCASHLIAQHTPDSLLSRLEHSQSPDSLFVIHSQLYEYYLDREPSQARQHAKQALQIAQHTAKPDLIFKAMDQMGVWYQYRSQYDSALLIFEDALELARQEEDAAKMLSMHNNIGVIYFRKGDYETSVQYFLQSLKEAEQLGDTISLAGGLNNLGSIMYLQGHYEQALDYYQQSLNIKQLMGDSLAVAKTLNNIGNVYGDMDEHAQAVNYLERSLAIKRKYQEAGSLAYSLTNLGIAYKDLKQYDQALRYYQEALDIDTQLENQEGMLSTANNIAELYILLEEQDSALVYAQQAHELALAIDARERIMQNTHTLAKIYRMKQDYRLAFQYMEEYAKLREEVYNEEKSQQIAELQTRYDTEKKELTIERLQQEKQLQDLEIQQARTQRFIYLLIILLAAVLGVAGIYFYRLKARHNRLLSSQNVQLAQLNATKDKLFSVIAHDLKNPLSAFQSITETLHQHLPEMSQEEIKFFIAEIYQSSHQLNDLLHNLLQWASAQIGRTPYQPEAFSAQAMVEKNIRHLQSQASEKSIHLHSEVPDTAMLYADRKMIQTILRNLLSNAIKFTPEGGEVRCTAEPRGAQVVLSVHDTGVGIAEENLPLLFRIDANVQAIGRHQEKGTGIGLILCKELAEKNYSQIEVSSTPGQGSTFTLIVPAAHTNQQQPVSQTVSSS